MDVNSRWGVLVHRSRHSDGLGNEYIMDDAAGHEQVGVHGQYDMDTTVENDGTITIHGDRTKETVGGSQSETIGANKTITVGANHSKTVGTAKSGAVSDIEI